MKPKSNTKKEEASMGQVLDTIQSFFTTNILPPFKITSVAAHEEGWDVEVEVIEEEEYMKKYAKDMLLGVYETKINKDLEVVSYQRVSLRPRSKTLKKEE
ncbi:gas vesicle protein GvpO [Sinobaca sp. H24]|uniref:gas vesicle protein GvpO n=1 Tax=Sinobaca sp. H24 TaxID=2923376 RepID=UPI002079A287|nr:gas vesicle protein GvpO [Sinobaca sp. H24]